MNMFRGRVLLLWNEPKIVGFQDEHKGIPCRRMLVWPSPSGSLCHKHFFSNSRTSCSWLPRQLYRRTRSIVCTSLYTFVWVARRTTSVPITYSTRHSWCSHSKRFFEHMSKGTNNDLHYVYKHVNVRTHVKTLHSHRDRGIRMFVQEARHKHECVMRY